jgi:hypothetical protein
MPLRIIIILVFEALINLRNSYKFINLEALKRIRIIISYLLNLDLYYRYDLIETSTAGAEGGGRSG